MMAAAAPPEMGYPRRANGGGGGENLLVPARVGRGRGGVARQLLDSGRAFMVLGALVLTRRRLARCNAEHVLAVGLAMLSLVAAQFPGLAAADGAPAAAPFAPAVGAMAVPLSRGSELGLSLSPPLLML